MDDELLPGERALRDAFAVAHAPASTRRFARMVTPAPRRRVASRPLRISLSVVVAVAVGVGTFAILRTAEMHNGNGGPSAVAGPSPSGSAAPVTSPATTAAAGCRVPTVEYGAGTEPAGAGENWVPSVTAGFVSCETGAFTVDPSAPRLGAGDHDLVYIASAGWKETATGLANCAVLIPSAYCGWAPDGQEFAYSDDSCTPCGDAAYAGRVHVVDSSGDRTVSPPGEMDRVLGWTDQGIVVARISPAGSAAAVAGGGSGVSMAGNGYSSFADYLIDPTTGAETYVATTDAFIADGDAMWEPATTGLGRYDLGNGTTSTWSFSSANAADLTSMWFDPQGDPVIPLADRLVLLSGPGAATTLQVPGGPAGGDSVDGAADLPSGALLLMTYPIDNGGLSALSLGVDLWSSSGGWVDLGAGFSVIGSTAPTPSAPETTAPSYAFQRWPVFAGPPLTS